MDSTSNSYDLVFSLGGSCIGALQLRARGLRICSLPFDWLFHVDDSLLSSLAKCFKEDFSNWFLRENLEELKGDERGTSPHYQYKDKYTGCRFIHDFHKPLEAPGEYLRVKRQYEKRIRRLYSLIEAAENILILLNGKWPISAERIKEFCECISYKWPGKKIKLVVVNFSQGKDELVELMNDCIVINRSREENAYDYFNTNFEWEFLDSITLRDKLARFHRFIEAKRIPGGLSLRLLKNFRSIFGFQVKILKYVVDFSIGRNGN